MQIIRAIFEDGVFKPLEPVEIPPHQQVILQVEDQDTAGRNIVQLNNSWSFNMSGEAESVGNNGNGSSAAYAANQTESGEYRDRRRGRSGLDLSPNFDPGESLTRRVSIWDRGNGRNNGVMPSSNGKRVDSIPADLSQADASIWDEPIEPRQTSAPSNGKTKTDKNDPWSIWD
ncbi:MAG TPA: antitoxin family protein [Aggregatilineales bacterium]|nr:antitoxin family protein [Aggregatilineales bacterium]